MKQRQRKVAISDWLTLAIGRVIEIGLLLMLLIGLPVYGVWTLTGSFTYVTLRWVVVGLGFSLIPAFVGGFYVGRLETRGFLGGMDAAMDKLSRAVNLRDTSRIIVHRETRTVPEKVQPNYNVFLPQGTTSLPPALGNNAPPTITHRQLTEGEVVEL